MSTTNDGCWSDFFYKHDLLSCSGLPWSLAEVKVSPSLLPSTWFKAVGSVAAELPLSLASRATSSATAVPAHTLLLLNPLPLTLGLLALVCAEPALPAQLSILARSLLISTSGTLFWSTFNHFQPSIYSLSPHPNSYHSADLVQEQGKLVQRKLHQEMCVRRCTLEGSKSQLWL